MAILDVSYAELSQLEMNPSFALAFLPRKIAQLHRLPDIKKGLSPRRVSLSVQNAKLGIAPHRQLFIDSLDMGLVPRNNRPVRSHSIQFRLLNILCSC